MSGFSVEIENVSKSFGKVEALKGITLEVEKSALFGVIGPDGAGKTTLFRILTSLLKPASGKASLQGYDVVKDYKAIRRIVGYMPGRFSLYFDLTVEENLKFYATIFGTTIEENYHLVKDIYSQIEPFKDRKAGNLSGGMKQKLALSCAMIHKPEVLILDEPTTGVDAVSRKEFWDMLKMLKEQGITILVSTPYMDEASLCDRVALMQKGKILDNDTPKNIIQKFRYPLYKTITDNMYELPVDLTDLEKTVSARRFGDSVHLAVSEETEKGIIEDFLLKKGHKIVEVEKIDPGIEDCFMDLMTQTDE
ncbi:MAG: ABC transporter ATP-binding protein [Bacteroidales bacterium]|nr:ABC transporter ATP-binding protein [Bacteroidales bacterium]